jgi:DNA-binding response OmpR family regulator
VAQAAETPPVIALVGLPAPLVEMLRPALAAEGYAVAVLPLDGDVMRALARRRPGAAVLDGHAYVNTRAFLADLREQPETASVPVVVLGPARPAEVPRFEVVEQLGRSFDLDALLAAIRRAVGPLEG